MRQKRSGRFWCWLACAVAEVVRCPGCVHGALGARLHSNGVLHPLAVWSECEVASAFQRRDGATRKWRKQGWYVSKAKVVPEVGLEPTRYL